ncbi:MAG: YebC/PmpR family DNA-binding transcriptional regulator [Patescibacteria group bacterium]
MAGHSRWAQVKHKKAGSDARRGMLFSKLGRLISVAAREGGANPDTNPKLRQVIDQARASGIPKENIERAIEHGAGGPEPAKLRAMEYEAYGPGGMALVISVVTDNPNRTLADIKRILGEFGGRLAEAGSVTWMFERRYAADFALPGEGAEEFELRLIDAGAEDIARIPERLRAVVRPEGWSSFQSTIQDRGLTPLAIESIVVSKNMVAVDPQNKNRSATLVQTLEDHPDVTEVWTNLKV